VELRASLHSLSTLIEKARKKKAKIRVVVAGNSFTLSEIERVRYSPRDFINFLRRLLDPIIFKNRVYRARVEETGQHVYVKVGDERLRDYIWDYLLLPQVLYSCPGSKLRIEAEIEEVPVEQRIEAASLYFVSRLLTAGDLPVDLSISANVFRHVVDSIPLPPREFLRFVKPKPLHLLTVFLREGFTSASLVLRGLYLKLKGVHPILETRERSLISAFNRRVEEILSAIVDGELSVHDVLDELIEEKLYIHRETLGFDHPLIKVGTPLSHFLSL